MGGSNLDAKSFMFWFLREGIVVVNIVDSFCIEFEFVF